MSVNVSFGWFVFVLFGWVGWVFVVFFMVCYLGLFVVLVLEGFWLLMNVVDLLIGKGQFVGLVNFLDLFKDEVFLCSVVNIVLFVVLCMFVFVGLGLVFVLVLNWLGKLGVWLCGIFFVFNVLLVMVVMLIWCLVLLFDCGFLSQGLVLFGLFDFVLFLDECLVLFFIVLVMFWWGIGLLMMFIFVVLQQVLCDLYEVVVLDNISCWWFFCFIMLLVLCCIFIFVVIVQLLGQLQVFGQVQLLMNGGFNNSICMMVMFVYEVFFD